MRPMPFIVGCIVLLSAFVCARAQTTPESVGGVLQERIQPPGVTAFQLQAYLARRISKLTLPEHSEDWSEQEAKIRRHVLEDIAFHGWPREWIDSAPQFQETDVIETGEGYRLRKFRYEIVPGFESAAILYEPQKIPEKVPAILNVIGHEVAGNAAEYEQKRCINFAKRGILALSLSWVGFGELAQPENGHDYAADLDLVGANALGFFYLSMRRGLDFLASLPQVDANRIGVTGLSGGGWQTTMLGALDQRVAVSVEVAGIGALESNLMRPLDLDEIEENATDLTQNEDYPFFVAIRAPRPTMLIHNAEDDCCFRADLVKPYIYDRVRPFFRLFGHEDNFAWHENRDPGTHNYQLDNREQAYAFFTKHFGLPVTPNEIPSDAEIRPAEQLSVHLPAENLTFVTLARKLAQRIVRDPIPSGDRSVWTKSQREKLAAVLRYAPVSVEEAWRTNNSKRLGLETLSYRFDFSNGLTATGVWLRAISSSQDAPVTIVLVDDGYKAATQFVSERVNRGEQVLALDLLFNGATAPEYPADWEMLVDTTGDRALGLEAEQLLSVAAWLGDHGGRGRINLLTDGIRSQVIALVSAALEPKTFTSIESHRSLESLDYLLRHSVPYRSAPELFCLDLYRYFDRDRLSLMALPTEVKRIGNEPVGGEAKTKKYE